MVNLANLTCKPSKFDTTVIYLNPVSIVEMDEMVIYDSMSLQSAVIGESKMVFVWLWVTPWTGSWFRFANFRSEVRAKSL